MKYLVIFLVLSLVVLMAEPGEAFFRHIKAMFRGAKKGWRDYRQQKKLRRAEREGAAQQQEGNDDAQPPYVEIWK
ncbi:pteroicidin-alpha-like [Limanda limanda]|uniref:pteroicidin-alpha-like n=1 Tax=Limanda limanda TaxID=27771 RepID=UPI0029C89928|nr:pteroicidin-alpha-like [Limanda limanda]